MILEITRRIKFCAGHRLMNHGGKCENLHGHNYLVEFTICGNKTDRVGRVVDFSVIKKLFKGWLDENWDHGFLLCEADTRTIDAIRSLDSKLYLMPNNPTAENMAAYLLEEIGPSLLASLDDPELNLTRVAVWESEDTCAEMKCSPVSETDEWLQGFIADAQ